MREQSAYEGYLDRTSVVCLGRVVSVNSAGRRLRVKTIGMPGGDDLDLREVRILHGLWHPEGDEEVSIPRLNTYGVIIFIGSEAIWLGAMPLDMSDGTDQRSNQEELNPGDRIFKTIAGNKVILRTGGAIQIQSTNLCRTFWIPSQNLINSVCQNFELETSGGHLKWRLDNKTEATNLNLKVWNKLAPDNGITVDIGTIDPLNNEDAKGDIKPFDAADLIFDFKQGTLDEKVKFSNRSLRMSVKNDGSIYFDIGPEKFTLKVDSQTGDVTFETKGTIKSKINKDSKIYIGGQQYTEASGGIKQKMSAGQFAVGTDSIELLKKIGDSLEKIATWAGTVGATHTHIGNLGVPTTVPLQAADYVSLQTELLTLKLDIDTIRGEF